MNKARRCVAVIGLVLLGIVVAMPVAEAAKWHTKKHPLFAVHDGTRYAKAYGNFYKYRSESAHSMAWEYDIHPGTENGHGVYVETQFYWDGPAAKIGECGDPRSYGSCWWPDVKKQSARTTGTRPHWEKHFRARDLDPGESAARGYIKVCLDRRYFRPDWCSAHVVKSFGF
ncbi:MAG: hypothetical protein FWE71_08770 [Nocardioidaceae bacterium]|nr:hypothetical protein [Nocardioidaceae bacterium]MCL2612522.1 hypothetical protein [Nocardioidaceae bacterium]